MRQHLRPPVATPPETRRQAGIGLIGSTSALLAFLLLVLLAVDVSLHLAATATVSAAGWDSARSVAARTVDHDDPRAVARAQEAAEARFAAVVGPVARDAELRWSVDSTSVRLHVHLRPPSVLPAEAARLLGLGTVDRTFTVRVERVR